MKRCIILLDGFFGGLRNWKTVMNYLGSTCDIHVRLLPITDEHTEDDIEYVVNWLHRYINDTGLQNVILVGNSLGGIACMGQRRSYNPAKCCRRFFLRMLPDDRLVYFAKCGHSPMMEQPEEFNKTVESL